MSIFKAIIANSEDEVLPIAYAGIDIYYSYKVDKTVKDPDSGDISTPDFFDTGKLLCIFIFYITFPFLCFACLLFYYIINLIFY